MLLVNSSRKFKMMMIIIINIINISICCCSISSNSSRSYFKLMPVFQLSSAGIKFAIFWILGFKIKKDLV